MEYEIALDTESVNPTLVLCNNHPAITHFNSETRQMFETPDGSFIYFKDVKSLHKISLDTYTKLLIKLTVWIDHTIKDK